MAIRCGIPTGPSHLQVIRWIGLLSMMSGIDISLRKCLCLCGVSCVIGFQQKIVYCGEILFMLTTWSVYLGVEHPKLLTTFFWYVICHMHCGFMFGIGWGSQWFILFRYVIILFSVLSWRACREVLIHSLRSFDSLAFG